MTDPVVDPKPAPVVKALADGDINRVESLLRIVHDCSTIGPGLTNLIAEAMNELKAMDAAAAVRLAKIKAEEDKKAAEEAAKAQALNAKRIADEEAQAKVQQKAKDDAAKAEAAKIIPTTAKEGAV